MNALVEIHQDPALTQSVHDLVLEGYKGPGRPEFASQEKYRWLREAGSRLWLDSGDIDAVEKLWSPELEALTTNNTLVNQIVSKGLMDGFIAYAARGIRDARPDIAEPDLVIEVAFAVNAKLALSLVERLGCEVSVELHPDLGFDVAATLAFARRYYAINPDQFYIKVPMTPDGFVSARVLAEEGIPVNYTLGFSARQNYLATRFSRPAFVNVFLGRLNSVVEQNHLGEPENVGEKATLASLEAVKGIRSADPRFATRQIAASMRNGAQVVTLAGVDVLTMPPKVADEYLKMEVRREDVRLRRSDELQVHLEPSAAGSIEKLWAIDEQFIRFVDDAVEHADQIASGRDLMGLAAKHQVDLFRDWSADDRRIIRETGKIPDITRWPDAPIDDLMSISALESFAKDQEELDIRIAGLVRES